MLSRAATQDKGRPDLAGLLESKSSRLSCSGIDEIATDGSTACWGATLRWNSRRGTPGACKPVARGVYSCRGCQASESRSRTERAAIGSLKPNKEKLEPVASYKVAEGGTYAYPVISGKKIYIKDSDSVALWMIP